MAFSLARWAREHSDLTKTRKLLADLVDENVELMADVRNARAKLGLQRLALALEVERHKETCEHLRLMSQDCAKLELYRKFFAATVPDPFETDL